MLPAELVYKQVITKEHTTVLFITVILYDHYLKESWSLVVIILIEYFPAKVQSEQKLRTSIISSKMIIRDLPGYQKNKRRVS